MRARDFVREFDPGPNGFGPFRLYMSLDPYSKRHLIDQFGTLEDAEKEMEFQMNVNADKGHEFYYYIMDGQDQEVGGWNPADAYDEQRMASKIRYIGPGKGVSEGKSHISPSGVKTTMDPRDDDYEINYGPNGLVAKFRRDQGLDVRTGSKKVEEDQVTEVSKDYYERERAADEMGDLIDRLRQDRYRGVTPEIIKRMRQLVTVTGRARTIYGGKNHDRFGSAGALLDMLGNKYREAQIRSGQMPEFRGRANTSYDMAQQIAQQTRGQYEYYRPRTWTTGYGQRYRDPEDYVVYPTEQALDDAWQWLESRGQKVYYRDNFKDLITAIKIGRYVVEPASFTRGAFSKEPETTHRISVRSAASINQGVRTQADITDQQAAALSDIAATKSAKAIEGIRAIMAVLQGEEDLKRVIDSSKKIDPRDKAKLDAIIAAAGKTR